MARRDVFCLSVCRVFQKHAKHEKPQRNNISLDFRAAFQLRCSFRKHNHSADTGVRTSYIHIHIYHKCGVLCDKMAHARLQDVRTRVQVRAWRAQATPEPERTRQPRLAPLPHPPPAPTAAQLPLSGSLPRRPQQEAEVHPDLDLFRRGTAGRRLRLLAAALLHHPELEVFAQLCARSRTPKMLSMGLTWCSCRCSGDMPKARAS